MKLKSDGSRIGRRACVWGPRDPCIGGRRRSRCKSVSGTITLTSDYRFRGISQSDTGAALQGSVDYAHDSGLYLGVWASNIDFGPFGDTDSRIEIDLTAGFNFALSEQTEIGTKFVYYCVRRRRHRAGRSGINYYEIFASLSHNFGKATLSAEVAWTDETFGEGRRRDGVHGRPRGSSL